MKKMKKLKKLSLENEMKKEAEQIEKKVREDRSLDDIKVSDEMEKELFNKIQDYEYDKRHKKVVRKKKKSKLVIGALAAVLILVCGSVMTSVGSKSYWKTLWNDSSPISIFLPYQRQKMQPVGWPNSRCAVVRSDTHKLDSNR